VLQILNEAGGLVAPLPSELGEDELISLYRLMVETRLSDEKLLNLQRQGRLPAYYQVSGQEAQVGAAVALAPTDWVFTAYRELGVWIARGMPSDAHMGLWKGVPDDTEAWDVQRFHVTRLNATIGTHLPHAVGHGYARRFADRVAGDEIPGPDGVDMVIFGDGATSENDFHAAMNCAGVWKTPTIFLCQNNQVAQSTPIAKQTGAETLADKAIGYGMPGIRVDGMDPLAVYQAVRQARQRALDGNGPTFIEMETYRFAPHSTYDGTPVYRGRDEEAAWRARDPLVRMRAFLESKGLWSQEEQAAIGEEVNANLEATVTRVENRPVVGRDYSPRHLFEKLPKLIVDQLWAEEDDLGLPRSTFSKDDLWNIDAESQVAGATERLDLTQALNRTLDRAFKNDPRLITLGEDVGLEGGVFRVTEGMQQTFGQDRILDTPLSETGIVGTAVGMAMAGLRPIAEIEFAGFVYPTFDQIVGHVARIRWRYRSEMTCPMVIRLPIGTAIDSLEFHCDSPEAYFVHAPGLTVVYPSGPYDAAGLLAAAIESNDPVLFFEPINLYRGLTEEVPVVDYTIPIGRARVRRHGDDVTLVTYGSMVHRCDAAAELLAAEGISSEVIDLRTLYPWDQDTVLSSIEKTGRLVTVHEANLTNGFGAEVLATVVEKAAYHLESPPVRVGHLDNFWGPTQLEPHSAISPERIASAARRAMKG